VGRGGLDSRCIPVRCGSADSEGGKPANTLLQYSTVHSTVCSAVQCTVHSAMLCDIPQNLREEHGVLRCAAGVLQVEVPIHCQLPISRQEKNLHKARSQQGDAQWPDEQRTDQGVDQRVE